MSSSHLLPNPARGVYYPLSSRASSATLFLSKRIPYSCIDGATDPVDMSIAQGLLQTESPQISQRRYSFGHSTASQQPCFPLNDDERLADAVPCHIRRSRRGITSNTWTSSSGEGSEGDVNEDRKSFVDEYNRLAKKYGVQAIVPDEFIAVNVDQVIITGKQGSWIMRKLLRRTSSLHVSRHKTEKRINHKRSVSDMSLRMKLKKDTLKDKDLVDLVRLCGVSPLYLPAEYSVGTLAVPTCFRATAQYLVQHAASSRGIFRIPGAHSTVNALYNHYASQDEDGEVINGTVRCPILPEHIKCNVHDVASAFKKFLAGLPGGILGKAWLFDAFTSIYNQLDAQAELMRTKQSKVRARLIALAIATVASRHQRELICAVLGLLSMIGRAAETAPREDEHGRPLPTSDLMGYEALGIVFGPLLVGNLLESLDPCSSAPHGSLASVQRNPPKSSRGKHKKNKSTDGSTTLLQGTDKIRMINSITEMLITHWRDVVRHMKNLGALKTMTQYPRLTREDTGGIVAPQLPELFAIRRPQDWDAEKISIPHVDRSRSPTTPSRNGRINNLQSSRGSSSTPQDEILSVRKRKPMPILSQVPSGMKPMSILAPAMEEIVVDEKQEQAALKSDHRLTQTALRLNEGGGMKASQSIQTFHTARSEQGGKPTLERIIAEKTEAASHIVKQDLIYSRSSAKGSTEAPEEAQNLSNVAHKMLKERCSFGENTRLDAVGMHNQGVKQIKAPPFHNTQNPSEGLSNQPGAFSQVPIGIVSSRLRGIAASDPGLGYPSGVAGVLKTDQKGVFPQKRRPHTINGGSHTFEHFPKDPLSRVSREEDIASLASLAEVIQSQDERVHIGSLSNTDLKQHPIIPVSVAESRMRSNIPATSIVGRDSIESVSKTLNSEHVQEDLQISTMTVSPANTIFLPTTPRRSATEPNVLQRSGGSSVKALAARFGEAETNARRSPSPAYSPESRIWHGSLVEKAVVAPYTVNNSPIPTTHKLIRSDTSLQAIRNPVKFKIRTDTSSSRSHNVATSLLPNPLFSSSFVQDDSSSAQWSMLRPVNPGPRRNSDIVQVGGNSAILPQFSSSLYRAGDGNISFSLSRKSSLDVILPRPDEAPIAGHVNFNRPAAIHKDQYSSPLNLSPRSPFVSQGLPGSSAGSQRTKNQSTSILYTQIENLSRQLRDKADEADHLRRQLMMKYSVNDLGTLNQQLRQAKRELTAWRGRAEMAEKRLEFLSQSCQKGVDEAVPDEQAATGFSEVCGRSLTQKGGRSNPRTRNDLHDGLPGSEGTIRRASTEQWCPSETELDQV